MSAFGGRPAATSIFNVSRRQAPTALGYSFLPLLGHGPGEN